MKTNDFIQQYIASDPRLSDLEAYAKQNFIPIIRPESAVFLKQLILLKKPKKVLEIGTGIGYSGHIILFNSEAHLYTVELFAQKIQTATEFFEKSNLKNRVTFYEGDESEIIPLISGEFDFIFLDGAKTRYISHLPYLKKLLPSGGILIADNVLFGGMVSGETPEQKKKLTIIEGLRSYLKAICRDEDFYTSILSLGDGMALSIKK